MISVSKYDGSQWHFWFTTDLKGYATLVKSIGGSEGIKWKAEIK
jgi:hypothetical protein